MGFFLSEVTYEEDLKQSKVFFSQQQEYFFILLYDKL